MNNDDDKKVRFGLIERMFQFNDSEGEGVIDRRTYDLMVRLSLENVNLTSLWRNKKISEDEFARRRKVLFHKLAGQYAAAKLIVQSSLPFDKALFEEMVVNDPVRLADFELLDKGELSSEDYFKKDRIRIEEIVSLYRTEIHRRQEAGEPIKDKSHLFEY